MPPGGAVVFGRSVGDGGTGVNPDLGAEPRSEEGLFVGGPLMTWDQDSMASRSG